MQIFYEDVYGVLFFFDEDPVLLYTSHRISGVFVGSIRPRISPPLCFALAYSSGGGGHLLPLRLRIVGKTAQCCCVLCVLQSGR